MLEPVDVYTRIAFVFLCFGLSFIVGPCMRLSTLIVSHELCISVYYQDGVGPRKIVVISEL